MNYGHQQTFWTDEKVLELKELVRKGGFSAADMGRELGCSRNAVIGKLMRMGLASGRPRRVAKAKRDAPSELMRHRMAAREAAPSSPHGGEDSKARRGPYGAEPPAALGEGARPDHPSPVAPAARCASPGAPTSPRPSTGSGWGEVEAARLFEAPPADPVPFLEAVDAGRCLFFAGDPMAPDGPDMPVCGAPRDPEAPRDSRYCCYHNRARVDGASTLARMRLDRVRA